MYESTRTHGLAATAARDTSRGISSPLNRTHRGRPGAGRLAAIHLTIRYDASGRQRGIAAPAVRRILFRAAHPPSASVVVEYFHPEMSELT